MPFPISGWRTKDADGDGLLDRGEFAAAVALEAALQEVCSIS